VFLLSTNVNNDFFFFFAGGMFVIQGGTYAIAAPIWGMLCDKVLDPRLVTLTGSLLITVTFLFLGPVMPDLKLSQI
jgi:hypothetical protein